MWKLAIEDYARWWQQNRAKWKEIRKPPEDAWRDLKPHFVPAPDLEVAIDRHAPQWKKEMEIGTPDLRGLDVVFVIDATGSMQWVLDYFKSRRRAHPAATSLVSTNPRIGLTFYRDHGDAFVTKSLPLTNKLTELQQRAWPGRCARRRRCARGGLRRAARSDSAEPVGLGANTRRAVVLIGDAPPKPPTQAPARTSRKQCAEKAVALYVVKATGDELPEFAAIATAAQREAVAIERRAHTRLAVSDCPPLRGNILHTALAPAAGPQSVDRQVLGGLLADAINPQFRDRVEPLVAIMLALTTDYVPEKREVFGVASPPGHEPGADPQAR